MRPEDCRSPGLGDQKGKREQEILTWDPGVLDKISVRNVERIRISGRGRRSSHRGRGAGRVLHES